MTRLAEVAAVVRSRMIPLAGIVEPALTIVVLVWRTEQINPQPEFILTLSRLPAIVVATFTRVDLTNWLAIAEALLTALVWHYVLFDTGSPAPADWPIAFTSEKLEVRRVP